MQPDSLTFIFLNAFIINNFVLAMFLGLCPFMGVSGKLKTAWNMGLAVIFVLVVTSLSCYGLNKLLVRYNLEFLRLISYIAVVASSVQLVEMVIKKFSPALFRTLGIFLPLITTNCCVLGLALIQTSRDYTLLQGLAFSLGGGGGFTLALVLMAGLREKLELAELPDPSKGVTAALVLAGLLSLAFMGFAGLGG